MAALAERGGQGKRRQSHQVSRRSGVPLAMAPIKVENQLLTH